MSSISPYLVIAGTFIIGMLGVVHAVFTFRSSPNGGPMAPTNPDTRRAMTVSGGLGLAPELQTTLWRAWMGFNLSHSLGALAIALFIGIPAWTDFAQALEQTWWVVLALLLPWMYLALSIAYWFRSPTQGIGLASLLITSGLVLALV